jgi:hypothetical protein
VSPRQAGSVCGCSAKTADTKCAAVSVTRSPMHPFSMLRTAIDVEEPSGPGEILLHKLTMRRLGCTVLMGLFAMVGGADGPNPGVPNIPAMQALWAKIKAQLAGPDGPEFFDKYLRDTELPYLCGVVLSSDPKNQPLLLVLAMSDKFRAEIDLRVEPGHWTEKIRGGAEIIFRGVARSFSQQPFRLTIETKEVVHVHKPGR